MSVRHLNPLRGTCMCLCVSVCVVPYTSLCFFICMYVCVSFFFCMETRISYIDALFPRFICVFMLRFYFTETCISFAKKKKLCSTQLSICVLHGVFLVSSCQTHSCSKQVSHRGNTKAKETCYVGKRDLLLRQKRPTM